MQQIEKAVVVGRITPNEAAPPQGDARFLSLAERAAIIHDEAIRLQPGGDQTELKFALKRLIGDAQRLLAEVDGGINRQRKIERAAMIL
jgi:hypothetical protein